MVMDTQRKGLFWVGNKIWDSISCHTRMAIKARNLMRNNKRVVFDAGKEDRKYRVVIYLGDDATFDIELVESDGKVAERAKDVNPHYLSVVLEGMVNG